MDRASDDRAFEAILVSAKARTAELQGAHDSTTSEGVLGWLLMLAAGAASVWVLFLAISVPKVPSVLIFITVVVVAAAISGRAGWRKWSRWSEARGALQDRTDDVLIRPFVERLVPGATFSRPSVMNRHQPSLLFQEPRGASGGDRPRVEGRLAGLTAEIDEVRANFNASVERSIMAFDAPVPSLGDVPRWRGPRSR